MYEEPENMIEAGSQVEGYEPTSYCSGKHMSQLHAAQVSTWVNSMLLR